MKNWIFVLNGCSSSVPLIIDGMGDSKQIDFTYESGTGACGLCSIIWEGMMYIFGGDTYHRQISVVDQCRLTKIGTLPFDMNFGACAQRNNQEVFICFEDYQDSSTFKNCYRATGPLEMFNSLPSSTYTHSNTRIAVTSGKSNLTC